MISRGMVVGDLFNDGKMDAVVNNIDAVPALLRTLTRTKITGWEFGWSAGRRVQEMLLQRPSS